MEITTNNKTIKMRLPVGSKETYLQMEKMVELPMGYPMIDSLSGVSAISQTDFVTAMDHKVLVGATLKMCIVYSTIDDVEFMYHTYAAPVLLPFEKNVDMEAATSSMLGEAHIDVEEILYEPVKDENGQIRKVKVKIFLKIMTKLWETKTIEYPESISGGDDIEIDTKTIEYMDYLDDTKRNTMITGRTLLPKTAAEIHRVVKSSGRVTEMSMETGENELKITGLFLSQTVYAHRSEMEESLCYHEDVIPFTTHLKIDGLTENHMCHVLFEVEGIDCDILHTNEERPLILEISVDMRMTVGAMVPKEATMIIDGYSPTRPIALKKETVQLRAYEGTESMENTYRESFAIPNEEGILNLAGNTYQPLPFYPHVYRGQNGEMGIRLYTDYFSPKDERIELLMTSALVKTAMEGFTAMEGTEVDMAMTVDNLECRILNKKEYEVRTDIISTMMVFDTCMLEIVKEIYESKNPDDEKEYILCTLPGMVIYTVVEGDSLWKIAKTYRVTVDQLMKWNHLKDDIIYPDQKLILFPAALCCKKIKN